MPPSGRCYGLAPNGSAGEFMRQAGGGTPDTLRTRTWWEFDAVENVVSVAKSALDGHGLA